MTRALVVAPQWIGDAVMAEPLLATLAEGGAQLAVAALPWVAPVFRAMPEVVDVIELPFAHGRLDWGARRRVAASLRGRFDVAYVLPNSLKSALVPWLARIPLRIGYRGEGRWLLLNRRLVAPRGRPPMVAFYGVPRRRRSIARAVRSFIDDAAIDATLAAHGLSRRAYWTFAPGAEYGPASAGPRSTTPPRALSAHARRRTVVLLGSPGEAALCEEIAAHAGGASRSRRSHIAARRVALIAGARTASNDSGLMHRRRLRTAQVAVFGSTSPLHTPPLNEEHASSG